MAHIVELRELSNDQLEERLENAREEMFNLRFQKAFARLEDTSRLRYVRREIAQIKEVLRKRQLAIEAAALDGQEWDALARYVYEDLAWLVEFYDEDGDEIASAMVNLNRKRRKGRKERAQKAKRQVVQSYEVAE